MVEVPCHSTARIEGGELVDARIIRLDGIVITGNTISPGPMSEAKRLLEESRWPRAGEWQPIAAAPRDGSDILVAFPNDTRPHNVAAVYWSGGEWIAQFDSREDGAYQNWLANEPTHWMPLPDPPE